VLSNFQGSLEEKGKVMKSTILIAAMVGAILSWSTAPVSAELPVLGEPPLGEIEDALYEQDSVTADSVEEEMLFADQKRDKYNCSEACAIDRYRCERGDKNRPGTKANDRASAKCQEKYLRCLDKCENPTAQ
jgi:hypothetical protein